MLRGREEGLKRWRGIVLRWLPLMVWMGVVLAIGSSGALPMQEGSWKRWLLQKGIRIGEYAILGVLFYRVPAMNRREFYPSRALGAVCMTVAFAGLDEWRQTFIPGRSGDCWTLGSIL